MSFSSLCVYMMRNRNMLLSWYMRQKLLGQHYAENNIMTMCHIQKYQDHKSRLGLLTLTVMQL